MNIIKYFKSLLSRETKIPYSRFGETFEDTLQYFEKKYSIEIKVITFIEEEIYNKIIDEYPNFSSLGCFDIMHGSKMIHKHCPKKSCKGCNIFDSMKKRGKEDIREKFVIPIGNKSKKEAKEALTKLINLYNEETEELNLKGPLKPFPKKYNM